jgi:predicted dinucleotide-binding enzyme
LNIGIIGAGQIGATLIRQYSKAGHHVKMTNSSGIEKLRSLASETGASAVTLTNIATDVEIVVIAIPLIEVLKLPKELFKMLPQVLRLLTLVTITQSETAELKILRRECLKVFGCRIKLNDLL